MQGRLKEPFCVSVNCQLLMYRQINQTDCRADSTAKENFIWANISSSITSLLLCQSYLKMTSGFSCDSDCVNECLNDFATYCSSPFVYLT